MCRSPGSVGCFKPELYKRVDLKIRVTEFEAIFPDKFVQIARCFGLASFDALGRALGHGDLIVAGRADGLPILGMLVDLGQPTPVARSRFVDRWACVRANLTVFDFGVINV